MQGFVNAFPCAGTFGLVVSGVCPEQIELIQAAELRILWSDGA
jgi:hypothetical protein